MQSLPEAAATLLRGPAYGHVVTENEDGSPHVTMTWVDERDGELLLNTADGRRKVRNLRRNPDVVVSIQDPEEPQQYLLVTGRVVGMEEAGADEHIDRLAQIYLGTDEYPWHQPDETRLIVRITPERISGQGPWGRQQPKHVLDDE